jgi:SH3-like domain-containing protein
MDKVAEQRALASQLRQMAEKCRHQACRLRLLEVARWFEQDAEVECRHQACRLRLLEVARWFEQDAEVGRGSRGNFPATDP